ncbi:hypothetical protein CCR95_05760 [Thiocystis minor]|uniref:nicotinate-nucleotide--dimethylbenzimidazole phosphoribosyltransferase n=1 Tax=Thiocystis minor TaxID=61597 RepID=UPI00191460AB|nr:hypothetical protein [Thiocystis minor]
MKPDWLAVPAADPAAYPAWGLSRQDDARVATPFRSADSHALTVSRPGDAEPERVGRERKSACRIRVVLLVAERDPVFMSPSGTLAAALGAWTRTRRNDRRVFGALLASPDLDIEILDSGTSMRSGARLSNLARAPSGSRDDDPRHRRLLDIHRLDVALSLGRHAAERAKLAGRDLLVVLGPSEHGLASEAIRADSAWHASLSDDSYEALRRLGSVEIAARVGALIAGAQIGLPVLLQGTDAGAARRVACCLHPQLGEWLNIADGMSRSFATWTPSDASCFPGSAIHSIMVDARRLASRKASV